jgi:hypothetical protein
MRKQSFALIFMVTGTKAASASVPRDTAQSN